MHPRAGTEREPRDGARPPAPRPGGESGAGDERYRVIVESQAEMVCRFRPDGTILFANQAYARARGKTPDELMRHSFWEFIPEADRATVRAMLERLRPDAPEVCIENRFRTVDGDRWILWSNRALTFDDEGRVTEAQSSGIDITERKRSEAALERRFRQLQTIYRLSAAVAHAEEVDVIFEAAMDGLREAVAADRASVLLFDERGVMRFQAWRGLSERYREAVDGHSPWKPEDADARPITVEDARTDESLGPLRDTILSEGIHALAFIPLVAGDRLLGKFMVYHDRPHAFPEEELQVCQTIADHVAYAIERARAERALREAHRRKDEFLATLGHELRNPLAPLRAMLQVLGRGDVDGKLLSRARETMERQVDHLVRLVDDLLDVSRISRGQIRLREERVELGSLIADAAEDIRPRDEDSSRELTVSLPSEPVYLDADPTRLTQVVGNLLNNAYAYTGPEGRIRVSVERGEREAIIRVRDDGVGIAPEQLSRIFELFSQADVRPGSARQGGLGIGLALVRSLVELHGGTVEARSAGRGRGAEFIVRLPLLSEPLGDAAPASPAADRAAVVPRRILVVDDNRDAAESLVLLLDIEGHEVQAVFDGRAAVEAAAEIRPDVILLDLGLPELDGYEAARRIRQGPAGDAVLLVAVTGWSQEADRRRSREAGFDAHVAKPLDIADLRRLLAGPGNESDAPGGAGG